MAPFASRRQFSQAGLNQPRSLEVSRRAEVNGSQAQLFARDDSYGSSDSSQGMTGKTLTPVEGTLVVVAILIVLLVSIGALSWWIKKPRTKRRSTLKPLQITSPRVVSPMSEKRPKAASLPQIRIDPPQTSADITVAIATASSDASMVEIQPPPPVKVHGAPNAPSPKSPYLSSPEKSSHAPKHTVSQASILPSFYTVSGERPRHPVHGHGSDSDEDPFADPSSDDSNDSQQMSHIPLSPRVPPR